MSLRALHSFATLDVLEPRRLLSTAPSVAAALAPPLTNAVLQLQTLLTEPIAAHVDAAVVRADLIRFVDTWNGGQLRERGTSGMRTYTTGFDGLFRMNLDRQFNPINYYTNDQTIISQSRAIYMNVEAWRNAPAAAQPRFKAAVQKGADYLLSHAVDPITYNANPGGMWWGLQADGVTPPTHTTAIFGPAPRSKDPYGQVQSLFALVQAYTVTRDIRHLNGAFTQLQVWNTQFADTAAGPGAFLPTANESYTLRVDTRNVDYMTHAFELHTAR
jgi:hypothetical protein